MKLAKQYIIIFLFLSINFELNAEVFDGYTLFTPLETFAYVPTTYLMNNESEILNTWIHEYGPASMPYLLPDSSIIYPFRVPNATMVAGGVGGGIQKQTWDGEIIWEYTFADETYQHHHDVEPLPSGNILIIVWERKTAEEAYSMGREIISNPLNQMWSTAILELDPSNGEIVWEWHIWDHLIQDFDATLPNYGVISEHPELFDINCGEVGSDAGGPQQPNGDWMHINAINYNSELDQIVFSARSQNEIYIIDHSTTTEEAASHSGGNSGKGGDFLYRWGNPQNYNRGDENDKILGWQHGVNWIDSEFPGGGNIMIFNNNHNPGDNYHSAVIEIAPPIDENNNYIILENQAYGPDDLDWILIDDFATPIQGGAFRLPNGNTLVSQTHTSKIIEYNELGEIVWEYQFQSEYGSSWIARCQKYGIDYLVNSNLGDLNEDGSLNILDIVILSNLILSSDDANPTADLNLDGNLNILDIVILVNLILAT